MDHEIETHACSAKKGQPHLGWRFCFFDFWNFGKISFSENF